MSPAELAKKAFDDGKWSADNPYRLGTVARRMWRDEFFRLLEEWAHKAQES